MKMYWGRCQVIGFRFQVSGFRGGIVILGNIAHTT